MNYQNQREQKALIEMVKVKGLTGDQVTRMLMRIGMYLEAAIKLNIRSTPSPGSRSRRIGPGKEGLADSGRLLNSISYHITDSGQTQSLEVGSYGVPYAAIHEYGGTIYPKNGRALTIPVAAWSKGRRARDFGRNLFRVGRVLYDKTKLPGDGTLTDSAKAFVLARKAVIPARPYLRPAIVRSEKKIQDIIQSTMRGE